ncbi:hypothetical protein LLE49_11170 [Alicyclobacillus tolerans]|uniref:hypothetical protein n=1 Tax=Alicyclobacillus tolerans TaxID=90970 RepID=UPI001F1FCF3A|nr:hypothetical protein [Alicyclobacillus tolerans]MCF8565276.1 hypothetical protein [Alicyclobacillus tolerans]
MLMSDNVMWWISLIIPLVSLLLGFVLQVWLKRSWPGTLLVLGGSLFALHQWFSLAFWPWVLMYVFLDWLGAWAASNYVKWRQRKDSPAQ